MKGVPRKQNKHNGHEHTSDGFRPKSSDILQSNNIGRSDDSLSARVEKLLADNRSSWRDEAGKAAAWRNRLVLGLGLAVGLAGVLGTCTWRIRVLRFRLLQHDRHFWSRLGLSSFSCANRVSRTMTQSNSWLKPIIPPGYWPSIFSWRNTATRQRGLRSFKVSHIKMDRRLAK